MPMIICGLSDLSHTNVISGKSQYLPHLFDHVAGVSGRSKLAGIQTLETGTWAIRRIFAYGTSHFTWQHRISRLLALT